MPKSYFVAALATMVFAVTLGALGWHSYESFRRLETDGTEVISHAIILFIYDTVGLTGLVVCFAVPVIALALACYYNAWKSLHVRRNIDRSLIDAMRVGDPSS